MFVDGEAVGFKESEVTLNEEACRSACWVVDSHLWLRVENACHQSGNFGWRVELPSTLPLSLGEFPEEIFVGVAKKVWRHIPEAQAMLTHGFDERGEAVVIDDLLACLRGIEVDDVDNTLKSRVLPRNAPHGIREQLADARGLVGDVCPSRFGGDVEADKGMVLIDQLLGHLEAAYFVGHPLHLVIEDIRESL